MGKQFYLEKNVYSLKFIFFIFRITLNCQYYNSHHELFQNEQLHTSEDSFLTTVHRYTDYINIINRLL